ncbi:putative All-trans-retinol 13,14-reductase [uncultured delta proteobacterium]|uniref:Putative All-trans-retinol 13,14-reductase n=1 Tax=uncultured delta proteobacterium TaxID=34034 RepID=A0A212J001_9DELT|nr:putative All-trans-retinol 13,14-reductase [uncultured delta proteobacterium]
MAKKLTATVVGGGVSGMTAALILARFGHEVTLVERSPVLGLTVRGFSRDGVYFDTGLHRTGGLGENGPFTQYLKFLGLGDLPVVWYEEDAFETVRFGNQGRDIALPVGYEATKQRLHSLFPDEKQGIDAYLDAVRRVYNSAPFIHEATDIRAAFAEEDAYDTFEGFVNSRVRDPILRAVFSAYSMLLGYSPKEVSFLQHARVMASAIDSAATFAGGGAALADGFARRLEEAGVRIITGNGVSRVNFSSGGSIEGVTLDSGDMFDADTVIYTGHPYYLLNIVHDGVFAPVFTRYLRTPAETPSAYMLFGVSDKPLFPNNGCNLFYCRDTDFSSVFSPAHNPLEGPFHITTRPGTGLPRGKRMIEAAGEGYAVTAIMAGSFASYLRWKDTRSGERGPRYAEFKAEKLDEFREALYVACPETASVRFLDGATPLTFRDYTHSPSGSVYGRKHTLMQHNPQPATRVPGLWLAGQSIVAPGVLGAVISAFLTCGFIVGAEELHAELNR